MTRVLSLLLLLPLVALAQGPATPSMAARLDAWIDARFAPEEGDTEALVAAMKAEGLSFADVEALLRGPRASYPELKVPKGKIVVDQALACDHVDYATVYHLHIPSGYTPDKAWPLVLIGHGGNGSMSRQRARSVAHMYLKYWVPASEKHGVIIAAPATSRGWGSYGNSVLFSLMSKLQRELHIDPDRIYATGQSMGGHMSWRCAISFPDRFGAVGPQSGGYDYVEREQVHNLFNIPGYATHGKTEPYGIDRDNRKIKAWMDERDYPWVIVEKPGGHEIYVDEIDRQFQFFAEHPRDLYRDRVYVRVAGRLRYDTEEQHREGWDKEHTWDKSRPLWRDTVHWVGLTPDEDPKRLQLAAVAHQGQKVSLQCSGISRLRLFLHPRMCDITKPVAVTVNGKTTEHQPTIDWVRMLDDIRKYDDRGRVFPAHIDLEITTEATVPPPTFR